MATRSRRSKSKKLLRTHPAIAECAVVGVEDPEWGQRVCAAVETRPDCALSLQELREWAKSRMAPYKIPKNLLCVSKLPRNAMGKIRQAGACDILCSTCST